MNTTSIRFNSSFGSSRKSMSGNVEFGSQFATTQHLDIIAFTNDAIGHQKFRGNGIRFEFFSDGLKAINI